MPETRVKGHGNKNAKIVVVSMAPAREEVAIGIPMVGPSGRLLNSALLSKNIRREDIYVTNVLEFPLPWGGSIFRDVSYEKRNQEIQRLKRELETIKPNVVFALGDEPLQVLTGNNGITKWRGSILGSSIIPGLKVIPSLHPAWILRGMWKWTPVFRDIDLARVVEESQWPDIKLPKRDAITGPSFRTAIDYLEHLNDDCVSNDKPLAFDIETVGYKEIGCTSFCNNIHQAISIPFVREDLRPYWSMSEEMEIWRCIGKLLQNPKTKKIGQNVGFDWIHHWRVRVYPYPMFIDTMHLHHCLYLDFGKVGNPFGIGPKRFDEPGHGLGFINSQYTKTPYYKDDGRGWNPSMGLHKWWIYNAMDSMVTLDCAIQMMNEAIDDGLWEFYQKYYVRPFLPTLRMEWYGITIDTNLRDEVRKQMELRIQELSKEINDAVGFKINVNSPKQMQDLLYNKKGYQTRTNKKTGKPTVDKYALEYFADKYQDPVLLKMKELRQIEDLKGDLIDQQLGEDGRMHSHFNIGGAGGARWSSTKSILGTGINFQNLPRKGVARRLFLPE